MYGRRCQTPKCLHVFTESELKKTNTFHVAIYH